MVDVEPIMVEKLGVNDQKDKIEDRDIKGGDKSLYGSWMLVKRKNIQKLHCKAQIY